MLTDVYRYAGQINGQGYTKLCKLLEKGDRTRPALLIVATPGGDPHAGFRIARALQHSYEQGFEALVPRYCKSAGTMVLLGATLIYMADQSELGPLDIQIKRGDELYGRSSGLDMTQAVAFLRGEAIASFTEYMDKLVRQGLSTRISADIASKLVHGVLTPIAGQIDPIRLAEMQRATAITLSYGLRLSETGRNVQPYGLEQLVAGYPSHGFVIDRKEARTIFNVVNPPTPALLQLCYDFKKSHASKVNDQNPSVDLATIEVNHGPHQGAQDECAADPNGATSPSARESKPNRSRVAGASGASASRQPGARRPSDAARGKNAAA